ncbi:hypothetical protein AV274_4181 [Blastocystis sp. ATCC 50177/Nand II]|uniref:Uncharacterized protein n=1 Tax=Blastocystis sp. subtype 1 (strain ATCC 50177 / NandII) TaxID=478820 RepID=A0A196SAN6_BLAHN|nr:hypothetical protein AV274_4181 [Blastocystis sp. ATCC 50177/Nand II]
MGCMGSSLVEIDTRSNALIPRTLSCPITSFSQSPSSPLLAAASNAGNAALLLFDIRCLGTPLTQFPLPTAATAFSITWSGDSATIAANCGKDGVARYAVHSCGEAWLQALIPTPLFAFSLLFIHSNTQYHRHNAFLDDLLLVGDDAGVVCVYDAEATPVARAALNKSPVVAIHALQSFAASPEPSFLVATDTDLSLLSLSSSLSPISTTPVQEEKPDVVALSDEESEAEEWMLQGQQSDYARCSYDQFEIDLEDESVDYVCAVCEKGGESGEVEVKTKPVEEEKEEVEKEEGLEAMIRKKRKKNDRTGAMKLMLRYMLEQSLKQSRDNQRSIIVENDIEKAKSELEQVLKKIQKE